MDVSQSFPCAGKEQMLQYEAFFFSHLETLTHYEDTGRRRQWSLKGERREEGRLLRAEVVGGLPGGGGLS